MRARSVTAEPPDDGPVIRLSPREREVLRHHACGATARKIGDALFITEHTVRTHLGNIKSKLGVASYKELIDWWNRNEPGDSGR